jgi:hypothetical protein
MPLEEALEARIGELDALCDQELVQSPRKPMADAGTRGAGEASPGHWEAWANNIPNDASTGAINGSNTVLHRLNDDVEREDDDKEGREDQDSKNIRIPKRTKIPRWPAPTQLGSLRWLPIWREPPGIQIGRKSLGPKRLQPSRLKSLSTLGQLEHVSSTSSRFPSLLTYYQKSFTRAHELQHAMTRR